MFLPGSSLLGSRTVTGSGAGWPTRSQTRRCRAPRVAQERPPARGSYPGQSQQGDEGSPCLQAGPPGSRGSGGAPCAGCSLGSTPGPGPREESGGGGDGQRAALLCDARGPMTALVVPTRSPELGQHFGLVLTCTKQAWPLVPSDIGSGSPRKGCDPGRGSPLQSPEVCAGGTGASATGSSGRMLRAEEAGLGPAQSGGALCGWGVLALQVAPC